MIVDTSALVAVLLEEPGSERVEAALFEAQDLAMSAGTLLECSIVLQRRLPPAQWRRLTRLLDLLGVVVEPVTAEQAEVGRLAYQQFGPGSGSGARLNVGDCFAYALAAVTGRPLLFVGEDFNHTDLLPAI
ncbi:type II toxin-antitoxin system VapC family toxin [Arsenicicoccus piscis]|uniref:Ribonuclease VapC n=1 Tax=Arsenicicoccus piscis TaxID=673954 RepID=A0ABQ6HSZ6_9MICO|nr:type II toxin-antitoxin system VapC family toxin [Arsenicicoccus piscis]MCH8627346.1 type II toxin-antitoxin system VapC family toxin [Arsenicicoccus piscis]GMA21492.1 ribonuclease VapC42 [Arsenicicoccus piscis]GMA22189.1 ribonuclease VapC42 [Arsenicicoccus piscis]GMA22236.1 ribonuclease VapC42 [Arsenicicoccus piscis]